MHLSEALRLAAQDLQALFPSAAIWVTPKETVTYEEPWLLVSGIEPNEQNLILLESVMAKYDVPMAYGQYAILDANTDIRSLDLPDSGLVLSKPNLVVQLWNGAVMSDISVPEMAWNVFSLREGLTNEYTGISDARAA